MHMGVRFRGVQVSQRSLRGFQKASMLQQTEHTLKKKYPLPFQVKVKLYTKIKSKNITLPAYNIPLHREDREA